jgi:hypothetical protein
VTHARGESAEMDMLTVFIVAGFLGWLGDRGRTDGGEETRVVRLQEL